MRSKAIQECFQVLFIEKSQIMRNQIIVDLMPFRSDANNIQVCDLAQPKYCCHFLNYYRERILTFKRMLIEMASSFVPFVDNKYLEQNIVGWYDSNRLLQHYASLAGKTALCVLLKNLHITTILMSLHAFFLKELYITE